ncbi:MAG: hypothetical protein OXJ62_15190, partial [Spirochaetaceae bacterium]|nr:hypothetical protein [Spirochaetaceae bacterium]
MEDNTETASCQVRPGREIEPMTGAPSVRFALTDVISPVNLTTMFARRLLPPPASFFLFGPRG